VLRYLRLAVSLGLLAFVLLHADWLELRSKLHGADLGYFLVFLGMVVVTQVLSVLRWQMLLRARGARLPLLLLLRLYAVGTFYSQVLPSSIGGDVVRAAATARRVDSLKLAVGSIFLERLTGLIALVALSIVILALTPELWVHSPLLLLTGASAVGCVGVVTLILLPLRIPFRRRFQKLENLRAHLRAYRHHGAEVLMSILLSFVFQGALVVSVYCATRSVGYSIEVWQLVIALPLVQLITLWPISINGIGLQEWAYTVIYASLGAAPAAGLAASLLVRARNALWACGGYALDTWVYRSRERFASPTTDSR